MNYYSKYIKYKYKYNKLLGGTYNRHDSGARRIRLQPRTVDDRRPVMSSPKCPVDWVTCGRRTVMASAREQCKRKLSHCISDLGPSQPCHTDNTGVNCAMRVESNTQVMVKRIQATYDTIREYIAQDDGDDWRNYLMHVMPRPFNAHLLHRHRENLPRGQTAIRTRELVRAEREAGLRRAGLDSLNIALNVIWLIRGSDDLTNKFNILLNSTIFCLTGVENTHFQVVRPMAQREALSFYINDDNSGIDEPGPSHYHVYTPTLTRLDWHYIERNQGDQVPNYHTTLESTRGGRRTPDATRCSEGGGTLIEGERTLTTNNPVHRVSHIEVINATITLAYSIFLLIEREEREEYGEQEEAKEEEEEET